MAKKTATDQRLDDLGEKIDGGFDRLERALEKHATEDKQTFDKHDVRLRAIETTTAKVIVIGILVMAVFSAVAAAAARHFIG